MSAEYTIEQIVGEIFRRWDVLHKRIADLELENERLKQHVKDLDHDLNGTIEDCNKHHGEQG